MTRTPKKILLATDLSCRCDRALDRTVALAAEWGARLLVVHALETPLAVTDAPSWRRPTDARRVAERRIRADLRDVTDVELEVVVERGEPSALVLEVADRLGCDLIATGVARDETLGRILLGRTVETVVRRSQVPVLVVKSRPRGPYRRVMVASDFSETSRKALLTALGMFPRSHVALFHAFDVPFETCVDDKMAAREAFANEARREAEAFLASMPSPAARGVPIHCEYGSPTSLLRAMMEEMTVDLVVCGTRGRSRAVELLVGSVAQALLTGLPGDVLVVPRAHEAGELHRAS